ncbi:MAG: hypothetical protein V3U92_01155 [Cellulophaga sp.]
MNKTIPNLVITPEGYSSDSKEKYNMLYLLHGAGGNYTGWVSKAQNIKVLVDKFNRIIVCPDRDRTS